MGVSVKTDASGPILLGGSAKQAAQDLVDLRIAFEQKRSELMAKYSREMQEFATEQQACVNGLFLTIARSTGVNVGIDPGWQIVPSQDGTGDFWVAPLPQQDQLTSPAHALVSSQRKATC